MFICHFMLHLWIRNKTFIKEETWYLALMSPLYWSKNHLSREGRVAADENAERLFNYAKHNGNIYKYFWRQTPSTDDFVRPYVRWFVCIYVCMYVCR